MGLLDGKRILLGVGGGIAAYKAPEWVRRLRDEGADVHVMMTASGRRFVSELALEVVSEHPVRSDLWATDERGELPSSIVHTDLGKRADLIILAPATANLIGRIAHGLADDLVTTTVMACKTPVLVCPAMNTDMLENPLVQRNITLLKSMPRWSIMTPDVGVLACGVSGAGRMPDPPELIEAASYALTPKVFRGVRVTVSAGPTRESLDPVRFLSNRSTGTMGFAVARAFAAAGAEVTLIAGPVHARTPYGLAVRRDIETADELRHAVEQAWQHTDILVMTAAVADFRPASRSTRKIKKGSDAPELTLERTQDILAWTATAPDRDRKTVVGFAAESIELERYAADKLRRKGLDWIVANDISSPRSGFGTGSNAGVMLGRKGERIELAESDKDTFAHHILATLERHDRGSS